MMQRKASGWEITQTEALALLEDSAGSNASYLIGGA
jgi:hypothetical protein